MRQSAWRFSRELSFFAAVPAILWQVLFLLVPLSIVGYLSFSVEETGQFTLHNYAAILSLAHMRVVLRSAIMACTTAASCLILAYPVAYFLALRAGRWKGPLLFLAMVPFWTNFLVQIYAWFFLLEHNGVINRLLSMGGIGPLMSVNSLFAVFLVSVYCYLPFMIISLYIVLERIDIRLLEASNDLGATPWQTLRRVTLPLSMPGLTIGVLLVLIPTFGEFTIPALIGGSRHFFVGSLISYYSLVVRNRGLAAAFTGLSGLVLLGMSLAVRKIFQSGYTDESAE